MGVAEKLKKGLKILRSGVFICAVGYIAGRWGLNYMLRHKGDADYGSYDRYLETKDGFELKGWYHGVVSEDGSEDNPAGEEYYFEIDADNRHVMERLMILTYDDSDERVNSVIMYDNFHEKTPNKIIIFDNVNNTNVVISKNWLTSGLSCDCNIDEEELEQIFKVYSQKYAAFREVTDLDRRISEYTSQFEMTVFD